MNMQVEVRLRVIQYSKQMLGTCAQASTAKVGTAIVPIVFLTKLMLVMRSNKLNVMHQIL